MHWHERQSGEATQRPNDHRDPFQRDRARILHSAAFRRLQSKTQILGVGTDDFFRTRLTHSLEVSQIGTGLLAQLKQNKNVVSSDELRALMPSDALIESLCLAHDLGHPPFGHGGEVALNYMMRESGGFEANGQTFRIATKLEPYTPDLGMDLTRRTLLGLVKYPITIKPNPDFKCDANHLSFIKASEWKPIKGLFIDDAASLEWMLTPLSKTDIDRFTIPTKISSESTAFLPHKSSFKSFDCSIMELADDIAYGVHDLEDAIALKKVSRLYWHEEVLPGFLSSDNPWAVKHAEHLTAMLFSREHHQRKNAIGALVNHLITNVVVTKVDATFEEPLLQYNAILTPTSQTILDLLKRFVFKHVIQDVELQQNEFRGQRMLMSLFEAFSCDPMRLLPKPLQIEYNQAITTGDNPNRVICDYLAAMSDDHANRIYTRTFGSA